MGMSWIPFRFPGVAGVRCAFQTRMGGLSQGPYGEGNISFEVGDDPERVSANRTALLDELGVAKWREVKQVHGPAMVFDPEPSDPGTADEVEADGLGTATSGLALVIKTADCEPILLAHTSGKCIAALHAGWRGVRMGFPASGVRDFCDHYGLSPRDVMAVRGPGIGPGASEFVNFDQEWGDAFRGYYDEVGKTVHLWRLTRDQLLSAGLSPDNIFSLDFCTHDMTETFFSFRRESVCGRQANLIWISE
jgi:polyphenol oxidase